MLSRPQSLTCMVRTSFTSSHPKFWPSFTKLLRNLMMISIFEKMRLQQLRKIRYSTLPSIVLIFQKSFLTEPHTYLCSTLSKSNDFLTTWFESGHIFLKNETFSFCHTFFEQDQNTVMNYKIILKYYQLIE